jgi:5-methylthioadenosine/S-adenosylhomocysteine deaminase
LASRMAGGLFDDQRLIAMATRDAAAILGWGGALGSIEPGKYADLIAVEGDTGDPWARLVGATEANLALVMIDGVPRYGRPAIMAACGLGTEDWMVGGQAMVVNLAGANVDALVEGLTLGNARDRLAGALANLPELARAAASDKPEAGVWRLLLDEDEAGQVTRPQLPYGPRKRLTGLTGRPAGVPRLRSMTLDPLTVVDDPDFFSRLARAANLPAAVKDGLPGFYQK